MKTILKLALLLVFARSLSAQTNTFVALQHFQGTPTNPCVATFMAQNDLSNLVYGCDVNTHNWFLIGAAGGSGSASPGIGFPSRFTYVYGDGAGIQSVPTGNNQIVGFGTQSGLAVSATETSARQFASAATASLNTTIGLETNYGAAFGQGSLTMGSTARWSTRITTQTISTVRIWLGLMDGRSGDFATGAVTNATDAINLPYCAFRFSTTTDTTWKAICATDSSHQTVVDTGVTPVSTASTLFEIVTNGGTPVNFFINGAPVASITTNLPTSGTPLGSAITLDNKNTNTAESIAFFWNQMLYIK